MANEGIVFWLIAQYQTETVIVRVIGNFIAIIVLGMLFQDDPKVPCIAFLHSENSTKLRRINKTL